MTPESAFTIFVLTFAVSAWLATIFLAVRWALRKLERRAERQSMAARMAVALSQPADRASAKVMDGYLVLINFPATPADRFEVVGAKPPAGYAGDVTLTIRHREQPNASWRKLVILPPWNATGAPIDGIPSLGAEHELTLDPPGTELFGRVV